MRKLRHRKDRNFLEVTQPVCGEMGSRLRPVWGQSYLVSTRCKAPSSWLHTGVGCCQEMGEPRVLDQETRILAQVLPLLSPHSCGALTCKIGIVMLFLRCSGSPSGGQVRSWALKWFVTGRTTGSIWEQASPEFHSCSPENFIDGMVQPSTLVLPPVQWEPCFLTY